MCVVPLRWLCRQPTLITTMASDDDLLGLGATSSEPSSQNLTRFTRVKQRRQQRSCDICRQRKSQLALCCSEAVVDLIQLDVRNNFKPHSGQSIYIHSGDGPSMPDGCCSHCLAFGSACTYVQPYKPRGPKNTKNM